MEPTRVVILGAAGRDFHDFNVVYRGDPRYRVVAFTAQQIPHIAGRPVTRKRWPNGVGESSFFEKHLAYIGGRPDVWYVPLGPLYAYQIVREHTVVTPLGPRQGWERFAVLNTLDSLPRPVRRDPEALRSLLARYFERMRGIVSAHGGTVEKFIGDAVMAVFGVPVLHEDDALRAVRAAAEMRDALPELGLQARIGVNSGEVVTGTEERLATGDAVKSPPTRSCHSRLSSWICPV